MVGFLRAGVWCTVLDMTARRFCTSIEGTRNIDVNLEDFGVSIREKGGLDRDELLALLLRRDKPEYRTLPAVLGMSNFSSDVPM